MPVKNQTQSYTFAVAAILFWSTVATAFKLSLRSLTVVQLLFVASGVSLLVFAGVVLTGPMRRHLRFDWRSVAAGMLQGFFNPFAYYLILFRAYDLLPAQLAQPLNYTWPLVLVLLSAPVLGQAVKSRTLWALLISLAGVVVIAMQGRFSLPERSQIPAMLLCMGSSLVWAAYWLINTRDLRPAAIKLLYGFFFGTLYSGLALLAEGAPLPVHPREWAGALYTGFFEMGITFLLWMKAMQTTSSTGRIAGLVYFSPFLSLLWIHLVLGEAIHLTTVAGLMLIVAGILVNRPKPDKQPPGCRRDESC